MSESVAYQNLFYIFKDLYVWKCLSLYYVKISFPESVPYQNLFYIFKDLYVWKCLSLYYVKISFRVRVCIK